MRKKIFINFFINIEKCNQLYLEEKEKHYQYFNNYF